ncbi:MAG: riboflavin synthase subunit alpha [Gammaproteobacteria bacterium RIFCSPHIGHO2_12_FULL_45_9]|nr:MAG: riboflavin synthase subunit alpha [Gammaproteobacteria bacterium RIFCSPHIGHO2_12_FULL_45_9]
MFSGIVECTGILHHIEAQASCLRLTILPSLAFDDLRIGDSVSINGACLTVTAFNQNHFEVTVVPETLRLTNLASLTTGARVNLERALPANGRFGGHYVQGHIDDMGEITDIHSEGTNAQLVRVLAPQSLMKYIVNKGFITIDGMSITIIETDSKGFTVALIPHTQHVTIASQYRAGSKVNLEVDIMSKYAEKLLGVN